MFLRKALWQAVVLAAICGTGAAQAAQVKLGANGAGGLTAVIVPDAAEVGTQTNIYMAALLNGRLFMRNSTSSRDWRPHSGGTYPVAQANVTLAETLTVSVVDFDISALLQQGMKVFVAYGRNNAEILSPGHLAQILDGTPPNPAPTTPDTTTPDPTTPDTTTPVSTAATAACDTAGAPAGVVYSQNGNHFTISTNGQCIPVPQNALCDVPAPAQATGLSMLNTMNVATFTMDGITLNLPGLPNPFESIGTALINAKTCMMNVPSNYGEFSIDADVCYDITDKIDSASLQSASAFVTVTPPITEKFTGSMVNTSVSDCFATDAQTITDVFTRELWIRQADGTFLKLTP